MPDPSPSPSIAPSDSYTLPMTAGPSTSTSSPYSPQFPTQAHDSQARRGSAHPLTTQSSVTSNISTDFALNGKKPSRTERTGRKGKDVDPTEAGGTEPGAASGSSEERRRRRRRLGLGRREREATEQNGGNAKGKGKEGGHILGMRIPHLQPALTLENSGSVARDHLANERTWLAYLRTSLALASTGVALVQLFTISAASSSTDNANITILSSLADDDGEVDIMSDANIQRFARPLGGLVVALAIVVLAIGAYRYFRIQSALTQGRFPPARKSMFAISALLGAVVVVVFGVLVGVRQV